MASAELFKRACALTIGPPGGDGKRFEGLRIKFKVTKSGSSSPNKVEIDVYNLSAASRAFIEKPGQAVLLEAGYFEEVHTITAAEMDVVTHVRDKADWCSKLKATDGRKAYRGHHHKSFGKGTKDAEIIRHLAKTLGVKVGVLKGLGATFAHGRQLSGSARLELDALCKGRGVRWSIQDGVLQVLPLGEDLGKEAVVLSAASGMIGSPEKTEKKGYKVKTLLRGGINPGQVVQIKSLNVNGFFIAECVVHEGDTHGNEWYTTIETLPK